MIVVGTTHACDGPAARPVPLSEAVEPLVLAIDIGSGSSRCGLYDGHARPVKKRTYKVDHAFTERADGTVEIDADQVTAEVAQVIGLVTDRLPPGSVSGVVMDTFASSLVCVDAHGTALTPCITYADGRSAAQVKDLRGRLDEAAVHQRVGARLHASYHPPRLLWLRAEFPDVWARTARFLSLGEYVYACLAGVEGAATSTMAWAGMLNRRTHDVDEELLAATGTRREQFAPIVDPRDPMTAVSAEVARRWPALARAAWFPAVPDGFASNLGVGANSPESAALSAATSGAIRVIVPGSPEDLPSGLWAYAVSRESSIVGGALNDVGRVLTWLEGTLAPVSAEDVAAALAAAPRPGVPLVLPFLTGERATGWAADARAVLTGVTSSTTSLDLWRGAAEGVAVSYQRVFEQLRAVNPSLNRVVASGGVTQDHPSLMTVVAHALGFPVQVVDVKRVTMRGAAVLALRTLAPDQPPAQIPHTALTHPDPAQRPYYDALRHRFDDAYQALITP
ncbi:MAG: gluconokinase [Arachnia sp.]